MPPCSDLFTFDHKPDSPVELAGSVEGIPPLSLGPALPEVADVADEARLDVLVVQELGEDHKLLPQELKEIRISFESPAPLSPH